MSTSPELAGTPSPAELAEKYGLRKPVLDRMHREERGSTRKKSDGGLTLLMYGTREPDDVCYYPRSGKVYFVGLGLIARLGEPLDYWDGEE